MFKIEPDVNIGPDQLHRYFVIPRNRMFNMYLHKILKSDNAKALHDHPWWSISIPLKGLMAEKTPQGIYILSKWKPKFRKPTYQHSLIVDKPVWTLFITGPKVRDWGFWPNGRFVHWCKFLDVKYISTISEE